MATPQECLAQIVRDFDVLYGAYTKAGLFATEAPTDIAQKLLGGGDDVYRFTRLFLLADALLRHRVGKLVYGGDNLRHLAVFGGNNVGKSTVVNILAAEQVASTSLEGGHTRHAQAFVAAAPQEPPAQLFGHNPHAFARFTPVPVKALDRGQLAHYGIGQRAAEVLPQSVVLWDMPDCDATESRQYLPAVVDVVTWADVVVYVTSIERYAVAHLIEWVFLLHAAGIEMVECLNKTRRSDQPVVIEHQHAIHFPAMARQLGTPAPELQVVGLRYLRDGEEQDLWGPYHPEAAQLRDGALEKLAHVRRTTAGTAAFAFVVQSLERLLEPAHMEVLAQEQWVTAVETALQDFVAVYARAYLQSEQVIEPFSRLNLELLNLLDPNIPGLMQTIQIMRWVTRWPARLVLAIGRQVLNVILSRGEAEARKLPPECKAYSDAHTVVLNTLGTLIDTACRAPRHHPFWDALSAAWTDELTSLSERFGEYLQRHMEETEQAIKQAATDIYVQLQQRPLLLNALRGVRVSANVGGALVGFLLPVKGGIVHDLLDELIIAPALITGVEAATTGAVQSFVNTRRKQLVEKLRSDAHALATRLYHDPLLHIAQTAMQRTGTLGVSQELLARLPATLTQLQAHLTAITPRLIAQEETHGFRAATC